MEAVATLLGLGHLRPAPGTWASAAACLVAAGLLWLAGPWVFLILLVLLVPVAYAAAAAEVEATGDADPGHVVIDEVVGQWIALLPVGFGAWAAGAPVLALWPGWIAAFLLFRLFDVWKPWIVGWADARADTAGLLLDDVLAGVLAALGVIALAAIAHVPAVL